MKNIKNRRILITGAGSGLGKIASLELAKRGHNIYAGCLYKEEVEMYNSKTEDYTKKIFPFKFDIRNVEDRNKAVSFPIDTLICNSAIGDSGSVSEVNINRYREVFETNVFANFELVQIFINKALEENIDSKLIILSSLAGRVPIPFLSPYCASKACIDSITSCLRAEMNYLQKNTRNKNKLQICCIEPGAYATGFNKINIDKKYKWMENKSYFKENLKDIMKKEEFFWNISEKKNFDSIIKQYIKAVESKTLKHRYHAPFLQTILVQLGRLLGL